MTDDGLLLSDDDLEELTEEELAEYESLLAGELGGTEMDWRWRSKARPEQLPPEGPWQTLFLRGGRGGGKTYAASHILAEEILADPLRESEGPGQWAVVAPTYADARDTGIEAESGLLAAFGTSAQEVAAGKSRLVALWNRSLGELRLRDGSVVFADGADDGALRIQGKNLRGIWCDEIGLWRRWAQAFDESIGYALRKGAARLIVTGTPKADLPARALVRRLLEDPAVVKRRLRTLDNAENLSPKFLEAAKLRAGTRLGLQELEGELVEDIEGALWRRAWIDDHRVEGPPYAGFQSIVVGLDPADGTAEGAEQALVVAGFGLDRQFYILHTEGMRETPLEWLTRAIKVAREFRATRLVVEKNFGGRALLDVLEQAFDRAGTRIAYRVVTATTGKLTRAEPVAALYEQGRVSHIGLHPELEEQLLGFTAAPGEKSPDRLDAAVHAITDLMGYGLHLHGDERSAVAHYTEHVTDPAVVAWS